MSVRSPKNLNVLLHGYASLGLMIALAGIGFFVIAERSRLWAAVDLAAVGVGLVVLLWAFCAKCACRYTGCRHIIFGPLTKLLPKRESVPYTKTDLLFTTIGAFPLFIVPQYWLFGKVPLLLLFWGVAAVLLAEITLFICKGCGNRHCPACRA
jgi:hypothetical protein